MRSSDWEVEKVLKQSNQECSRTFFSRPTWSPDGTLLVASNCGTTQSSHLISACAFQRDVWSRDACFVGHASSVECSRFSPCMYSYEKSTTDSDTESPSCFGLLALGSQDGSVSIWSSLVCKPLLVIWGVFCHAVLDVCWSICGSKLYGCSFDGSVLQVQLTFPPNLIKLSNQDLVQLNSNKESTLNRQLPQSLLELHLKERGQQAAIASTSLPLATMSSLLTTAVEHGQQNFLSAKGQSGILQSNATAGVSDDVNSRLQQQTICTNTLGKKRIAPTFVKALENGSKEDVIPSILQANKKVYFPFNQFFFNLW